MLSQQGTHCRAIMEYRHGDYSPKNHWISNIVEPLKHRLHVKHCPSRFFFGFILRLYQHNKNYIDSQSHIGRSVFPDSINQDRRCLTSVIVPLS